ncbi:MAG: lipopolysaccharide biosynthesis protein [Bacteroidales bacterium]|nr:lipopolysaccharide biosynthesis protein [Bacteroidales bacterium]
MIKIPIKRQTFTSIFHKPYDTSTENGRANERKRRLALTAVTSSVRKVLQMVIPLVTLPITYNYLNSEVYGLWAAVTQFFGLFAFSDLGLGNGLYTKLSQANGKDDLTLCKKIISNTFCILLLIAVALSIIFVTIFPFVNWAELMNAQGDETISLVPYLILIIVGCKLFDIPIAIIQRTQYALQEGYRNDIWGIMGALLSLCSIIVIARYDLGKLALLIVSTSIPVVVSLINMLVYFNIQRKELKISFKMFDIVMSKDLLSLGIYFCLLSVLTSVGYSMDTFIVAKTCSLTDAASYSVIYKISIICSAIMTILGMPLWGANGEAIARGDIDWVKKNTRKMSLILGSCSILFTICVMLSINFILRIWMGESFKFSYPALLWLCVMQIMFSFINPYFMVLNAYGIVKKQILLFLIYTSIVFALKYYLSLKYSVVIIPAVGSLLYMIIVCIPTYRITCKLLRHS